jgi:hypothetical protein
MANINSNFKVKNLLEVLGTGTSTVAGSLQLTGALSGVTTGAFSGQITSTLVTGTAPFVVASTTLVSGLSAQTAVTATTATNIAAGTAGQLHYQTGAGATGFVAAGTAGQVLRSGGAAIPVYSTATFADTYAVSTILYASASNAVTGLATANGGILNTGATGIPSVTATPLLGVAGTTAGTLRLSGVTSGVVTIATASTAGTWSLVLPASAGSAGQLVYSTSTAWAYTTATYPLTGGTNLTWLRSNGTNIVNSTSTLADTFAIGTILIASAANVVTGLAAGATTTILVGGGAAAPVWTTATGTGAPMRAGSPAMTGTATAVNLTTTGLILTPAAITGSAYLRLPHGTAPSAPVNGDLWTTTAGMYARINGATVGPFGAGGGTAPTGTGFYRVTSGVMDAASIAETGSGSVVRATSPQFTANVGLGIAAAAGIGLYIAGTGLGSGTGFDAIRYTGTTGSGVTSAVNVISITPQTTAAVYTLTDLRGILINDAVKGASSVITTQVGVNVGALSVGGTNIAYQGAVAAAAANWNLYLNGTAKNYIQGTTIIGTTTDNGADKFQVTGNIYGSANLGVGASNSGGTYGVIGAYKAGYAAIHAQSLDGSGVNVVLAANAASDARLNVISNHSLGIYTNNTVRINIAAAGSMTVTAPTTFQDTNCLLISEGTGGYGSFYAKGSAANPCYLFMNNVTTGELCRIAGTANTMTLYTGTGVVARLTLSNTTADFTVPITSTGAISDSIGNVRVAVQHVQNAAYTLVAADAGKMLTKSDTTARTHTIPSNASVAYTIGTMITFVNAAATANLSIAITTDTMYLAGTATTGTRTLAPRGVATAIKVSSTVWHISGAGLT